MGKIKALPSTNELFGSVRKRSACRIGVQLVEVDPQDVYKLIEVLPVIFNGRVQ
jgi:hypothetical protein